MQIDNQKNTYRIWLRRMAMAIGFTVVIIILLFVPFFKDPDSKLTEFHLIAALALLYVCISVILTLKTPYFISFSDQGEMIIFRYYPLSMFNSRKHSIEIPKQHFIKYELKPFFFGRHHKIILYQHFRDRVVGYPPVSLSAMDRNDQEKMLASLQKYSK